MNSGERYHGGHQNHGEKSVASARERIERAKAQSLGRLAALNTLKAQTQPEISLDDFYDIYDADKIDADKRYMANIEERFNETNKLKTANIFEQMFINGVMLGNWLGGTVAEGDYVVEDFTPNARSTNRYDDLKNRIDTVVALNFNKPMRDEESHRTMTKLILGFDVTVNNSRQQLLDKITRSSNTETKLPFGFSEVSYYQDDKMHDRIPLLPRYVVGLSNSTVNSVLESSVMRQSDGTVDFELFSAENLFNRFRILSEIRAENELYQAMLPDKLYTRQMRNASTQLYIADKCLHKALQVCTRELIKRDCLPEEIKERVTEAEVTGRGMKARNIIQEYLLEHDQEVFDSESKAREEQGKPTIGTGDTFVQIMQLCGELKDAAYAGKLERFRGMYRRNFGLKMPRMSDTASA